MIVNLDTQRLKTLDEVRAFLTGSSQFDFTLTNRDDAYRWIEDTLRQLRDVQLGKADKGAVRSYFEKVTGFSRAQITRLIAQFRHNRRIRDRRGTPARPFPRRYTAADIELLAATEPFTTNPPGQPYVGSVSVPSRCSANASPTSPTATCTACAALPPIAASAGPSRRPRATSVSIGERRKPRPEGKPGYLRIDSVHQGDLDGIKGLYHVNAVDEVTQWQGVFSVAKISERFLIPGLELLLASSPFTITGFHSDNGSEYVNHKVAALLAKLNIEFTKSRSRQTNDNALVESKNGTVVRKHFGYAHIPAAHADPVNQFAVETLSPYLNFHRPCFFPEVITDKKGKVRKKYPYQNLMTPYEKLKSIPNASSFLTPGVTFEKLDEIAFQTSDNEAARRLQTARAELFQSINQTRKSAS